MLVCVILLWLIKQLKIKLCEVFYRFSGAFVGAALGSIAGPGGTSIGAIGGAIKASGMVKALMIGGAVVGGTGAAYCSRNTFTFFPSTTTVTVQTPPDPNVKSMIEQTEMLKAETHAAIKRSPKPGAST